MERNIIVTNQNEILGFVGGKDRHLKLLQENMDARLTVRGNEIRMQGTEDALNRAESVIREILSLIRGGRMISEAEILSFLASRTDLEDEKNSGFLKSSIKIPGSGKIISARSPNQARYLDMIHDNDIVVGVGPAGTGKTYLAMAYALESLLKKKVKRIILTRPVVEAGESLGFLPGNLEEKVHPYLRPLYDAIFDMIDYEKFEKLVESGAIEIAPLAYMRGRTLHDSFIILDEAQNTQSRQMKMFLTRLGLNSIMVITGDISQIDLPAVMSSGLVEIIHLLKDIPGIGTVRFTGEDVVRHALVRRIIAAYENAENLERSSQQERS